MNQAQAFDLLITGASGLLGGLLVKAFSKQGYSVVALARSPCPQELKPHCDWRQLDLNDAAKPPVRVKTLIHAAPVWLLPGLLSAVIKHNTLQRCIVFSSSSVLSRVDAPDQQDRRLAQRLSESETANTQSA